MFDLEQELKNLPEDPGVYIMHDKDDKIIYVGKAKILKNRVRQYFQKNSNHTPKVLAMVSNVAYFEYIVTDSETEALALECNLIKKHRPKYNILLKDAKYYPGLRVVPIVMLGELFFGIYFNLSFWYKLIDQTQWGAYFSTIGCVVTVLMIVLLAPVYGYMACG